MQAATHIRDGKTFCDMLPHFARYADESYLCLQSTGSACNFGQIAGVAPTDEPVCGHPFTAVKGEDDRGNGCRDVHLWRAHRAWRPQRIPPCDKTGGGECAAVPRMCCGHKQALQHICACMGGKLNAW